MRMRYPVATISLIIASAAAPVMSGNIWTLVGGLWLACVPGIMTILEYEDRQASLSAFDSGNAGEQQSYAA